MLRVYFKTQAQRMEIAYDVYHVKFLKGEHMKGEFLECTKLINLSRTLQLLETLDYYDVNDFVAVKIVDKVGSSRKEENVTSSKFLFNVYLN